MALAVGATVLLGVQGEELFVFTALEGEGADQGERCFESLSRRAEVEQDFESGNSITFEF